MTAAELANLMPGDLVVYRGEVLKVFSMAPGKVWLDLPKARVDHPVDPDDEAMRMTAPDSPTVPRRKAHPDELELATT